MKDTIEVKRSISDTLNLEKAAMADFDAIKSALSTLDQLLAKDHWTGDSYNKCVQIFGMLKQYTNDINAILITLQAETASLENNMLDFNSLSDCVRIISSI